jgi:hypothetical protein
MYYFILFTRCSLEVTTCFDFFLGHHQVVILIQGNYTICDIKSFNIQRDFLQLYSFLFRFSYSWMEPLLALIVFKCAIPVVLDAIMMVIQGDTKKRELLKCLVTAMYSWQHCGTGTLSYRQPRHSVIMDQWKGKL